MAVEYSREIDAILSQQSSRTLLSFRPGVNGTDHPFTLGGNASTKAIAIDTSTGYATNGAGTLKISGQDAAGAGLARYIHALVYIPMRNRLATRYKFQFSWFNPTALADWYDVDISCQLRDGVSSYSANIAIMSTLGVGSQVRCAIEGGEEATDWVFPSATTGVGTAVSDHHEIVGIFDISALTWTDLRLDGDSYLPAGALSKSANTTHPNMFYLAVLFNIDADNVSHEFHVTGFRLEELE